MNCKSCANYKPIVNRLPAGSIVRIKETVDLTDACLPLSGFEHGELCIVTSYFNPDSNHPYELNKLVDGKLEHFDGYSKEEHLDLICLPETIKEVIDDAS